MGCKLWKDSICESPLSLIDHREKVQLYFNFLKNSLTYIFFNVCSFWQSPSVLKELEKNEK